MGENSPNVLKSSVQCPDYSVVNLVRVPSTSQITFWR